MFILRLLTFLTVLLFATSCYSQNEYEGYYVTNGGQKVLGYFKQTNFYNSNSLYFKNSSADEFIRISPDNIIEYGVGSDFKFVKYTVKIDKSDNNNVRMYSNVKDPQFVTEPLFLNVLVEGQYASLYSVDVNKSIRYFYALKDEMPSQLLYKKYMSVHGISSVNRLYQKQLYTDVNCNNESVDKFSKLEYDKKELVNIFTGFNTCKGSVPFVYANNGGSKSEITYNIFGGLYNNTLTIEGEVLPKSSNTSISFGVGGEIGFLIPSGKWEFFLRAEYEKINGETTGFIKTSYNEQTTIASLDANVLNVNIGPRYYIVVNEKNKLFLDAAIGLNSPSGDYEVQVLIQPNVGPAYQAELNKYSLNNSASFNFGIGYIFNRLGVRLMYETSRKMFDATEFNVSTGISRYGINMRYSFN